MPDVPTSNPEQFFQGAPLLLVIPNWTAVPPAHYSLSVQDAATGQQLGEYRFEVSR